MALVNGLRTGEETRGHPTAGHDALVIAAPVAGSAIRLASVPDPVFSASMVGPGAAVDPVRLVQTAVAPVTGTLVKLKPHAFVVTAADGRSVLIHLGIDTVDLDGTDFHPHAAEGDSIRAGEAVVTWNPRAIEASGRSPICPVIALDTPAAAVAGVVQGTVDAGQPLFTWL